MSFGEQTCEFKWVSDLDPLVQYYLLGLNNSDQFHPQLKQ